jgi:methyl-accepting chemotaxis protein
VTQHKNPDVSIATPSKESPLHQAVTMECGAAISRGQMEAFVESFRQSARRWEVVVYPALSAFALLAIYGFFLIYNLSRDMSTMAISIDPRMANNMASMTDSIATLADNVQVMTGQIQEMTRTMQVISVKLDSLEPMLVNMETMQMAISELSRSVNSIDQSVLTLDGSITEMGRSMQSIDKTVVSMSESMQSMTVTTHHMQVHLMQMNRSMGHFARPASMFNSFMPF